MKKLLQILLVLVLALSYSKTVAQPTTQPALQPTTPTSQPVTKTVAKEAPKKIDTQDLQAWWQHLVITVISTTGAVAVPVLTTLLIVLLRRWNIKLEYQKAEWFAIQGKNYAEQMARNVLREGRAVDTSESAKLALRYSRELATGKLAPWASKELAGLIEARLGADNQYKPKPEPKDPTQGA